ncbi:glutamine synthetase family protein [Marininema halotolerans]|uniref:Glutamine synthetase n=1 Tax=Marininema halotolerans TaxID=1155944 RepID=A0A1I6NRA9_9BACL|nr:glutamine synthetase family protein [Marininema halotolerans]SFS30435.1 glutamine synthetase [Marininema halotolerans]
MDQTVQISRNRGRISKEELISTVRNGQIDTVILAICDMQGRLMGKRLTGEFFLQQGLKHGAHFCNYLLGTDMEMNTPSGYQKVNWSDGYGDWLAQPDWNTVRVISWLERTALILCDAVDESTGELIDISPRSILKRQVDRARKKGIVFSMASELEFFLMKDTYEEAYQKGYEHLQLAGHYNEDYNLLQGTRNEPFYRKLRQWMAATDIPIESSKGEASIGQHEVNIGYSDALIAADRHALFKHGAKEIGIKEGVALTFMAKPDHRWTGSSGHIHMSAQDLHTGKSLFYDAGTNSDGMSSTMQCILAGVLAYTRDFALCFAPNINSYKRFAIESWAPVHIVWSRDNRSSGYRIVGSESSLRMENRITGADINPYLAYAAMIGAGLQGLEEELTLATEHQGNAYEGKEGALAIPRSLYEAVDCWERSEVVKKVLGEEVAYHYGHAARLEQQAFDMFVTNWERRRYFEQG